MISSLSMTKSGGIQEDGSWCSRAVWFRDEENALPGGSSTSTGETKLGSPALHLPRPYYTVVIPLQRLAIAWRVTTCPFHPCRTYHVARKAISGKVPVMSGRREQHAALYISWLVKLRRRPFSRRTVEYSLHRIVRQNAPRTTIQVHFPLPPQHR